MCRANGCGEPHQDQHHRCAWTVDANQPTAEQVRGHEGNRTPQPHASITFARGFDAGHRHGFSERDHAAPGHGEQDLRDQDRPEVSCRRERETERETRPGEHENDVTARTRSISDEGNDRCRRQTEQQRQRRDHGDFLRRQSAPIQPDRQKRRLGAHDSENGCVEHGKPRSETECGELHVGRSIG